MSVLVVNNIIYVSIANAGPQGAPGVAAVTAVEDGPYTAAAVTGLTVYTIYNSSDAGFSFELPAEPALNQIAQIIDAGLNAGTYAITIHGNGNPIVAYGSSQSSIEIASNGGSASLAWDGTNWVQNG